jgi:imidazolonepropionase-like amidohydrolase
MMERMPSGYVLANCLLFDGTSTVADQALWIVDGTIREVGASDDVRAEAKGAAVIDLDGDCVLPGLVNMHVHFGLALPGQMQERARGASDAELVLSMAASARGALRAGVTTVRLVGESRYADFALRRAIEAGAVDGPRVFTAGHALCCTGGHGWDADALEADGADGFRRATREQLRAGADLIKICISGGIAGEHESIDTPQLTDAEIAAVIDTAHDWGRKVTAHAGPAATTRRAVDLGLDCVEHGYELTTELTDEMARRGVWYVPTIVVSRCKEYYEANEVPEWMQERALAAGPLHWKSLQNALRSGVSIALGSDMPPHALYDETSATVRELEFMVEAGMSDLAALQAATIRPIEWLGATDRLGSLAVGKRADLIAVQGDPSRDISALRTLNLVLKDGQAFRDGRGRFPRW